MKLIMLIFVTILCGCFDAPSKCDSQFSTKDTYEEKVKASPYSKEESQIISFFEQNKNKFYYCSPIACTLECNGYRYLVFNDFISIDKLTLIDEKVPESIFISDDNNGAGRIGELFQNLKKELQKNGLNEVIKSQKDCVEY